MRGWWKAVLGLGFLVLLGGLLAACDQNASPQISVFQIEALNRSVLVYWEAGDPDGDDVTCLVSFGDGAEVWVPDCTQTRHLAHTYDRDGEYVITLRARDSRGSTVRKVERVRLPDTPSHACPPPAGEDAQALERAEPTGLGFAPAAWEPGALLVRTGGAAPLGASPELGVLSAEPAGLGGWQLVRVPKGEERAVAERLLAEGLASYVQPVYRYRPLAAPNDPYFEDYQKEQYDAMRLVEGWSLLDGDACRPIVAVLDSGADFDHEDLGIHLLSGYDFSDDDPDASYDADAPEDLRMHGTMVAGIIAADTNNEKGVAGSTNDLAYVLPLKIFSRANSRVIADALRWAADAGAHLANLSFCILDDQGQCADLSESPDEFIEDALKYARERGLIPVAASGNDGNEYVGYPASSDYTIAVGASDNGGYRSTFSNYGDKLDFVAPGEEVASTAPARDEYRLGSGTSYATPYVVGVLALYLGQHYALEDGELPDFAQAYNCLLNNASHDGDWDRETGYGIPEADRVLDPEDGACYP